MCLPPNECLCGESAKGLVETGKNGYGDHCNLVDDEDGSQGYGVSFKSSNIEGGYRAAVKSPKGIAPFDRVYGQGRCQ